MIETKTNISKGIKAIEKYARSLHKKYFKEAMFLILQNVANRSTQKFWVQTKGIADAITKPVHDRFLTQRTGRLIGSVAGALRFSIIKMPTSLKRFENEGAQTIVKFPKGKSESIREVIISGKKIEGIIGTKVLYGIFHEEGTKIHKPRPFLKPAAEKSKSNALNIFKNMVEGTWKYDVKKVVD